MSLLLEEETDRNRLSLLFRLSGLDCVREVDSVGSVERRLSDGLCGGEIGDESVVAVVITLGLETPSVVGCGLRGVIGVSSSKEGRWKPGLGSGEVVFNSSVGFVSADGREDAENGSIASIAFRWAISLGG